MSGKWGRRHRAVYAYDVADYRTPTRELAKRAYIGKSSSNLIFRDTQHRHGKLWAPAICGPIYPLWEGDCGRISLWFREVYYIRRYKPLFNVQWNKDNPNRIPPWEVRRLYERRDVAYRGPRVDVRSTR